MCNIPAQLQSGRHKDGIVYDRLACYCYKAVVVNLLLLLFTLLCVVRYHVFMSVECGNLSGANCHVFYVMLCMGCLGGCLCARVLYICFN